MMSGLSATDEKLRIFVSSTINECDAERAIARKAIESLNHTAILFEAVGARPYPPRETYATRLRESDVMVAIYRQEYGWIAEGLSISGVHDEFLIAREARIPVLAYVLRPAPRPFPPESPQTGTPVSGLHQRRQADKKAQGAPGVAWTRYPNAYQEPPPRANQRTPHRKTTGQGIIVAP